MTSNPNQKPAPLGNDEIREILVKRIDQQKQALGIAIGVVEPNGRRAVTYGKLAKDDPRALDGDTIFEIGSVTKVFTSLLLADMVTRGEVALDDPASRYLPSHVQAPERNGKQITLLDLATHYSGFPKLAGNFNPKDPANPYADYGANELYQFLSGHTLPRDPGAEFEYSNLGAGLLGHVLACRAGSDYESLIRSRITEPLGMHDTAITLNASMRERMATGHNISLDPVPYWDFQAIAGAGALHSCLNDLLTLLEAFLGYKDSPLAPAMKLMFEVRRPIGTTKAEIALGWHMLGGSSWHSGGTGGFLAFLAFDPKSRTGVAALSNAVTLGGIEDIATHTWNPSLPLRDLTPPTLPTAVELAPDILDRYVGRYQLAADRLMEISRDGTRVFLQVTAQANGSSITGPKFELVAENESNFVAKATGTRVAFETAPDGRVAGLRWQPAGRDATQAPRLT